MKKRLLSAALALAMVLTMLPLTARPAYADAWTDGMDASYHAKFDNQVKEDNSDGNRNSPSGWYAAIKNDKNQITGYSYISSGIIFGNKVYGSWGAVVAANRNTIPTSFTVIGTHTVNLGKATSVTVDLYGGTNVSTNLSIVSDEGTLTTVTLNDSKYATEVQQGLRQASRRAELTSLSGMPNDKSVNIRLTNVGGSAPVNFGGYNVTRSITLLNASLGTVTLDGVLSTDPTKQAAQTITASAISTNDHGAGLNNGISSIRVTGTGSRVTLTDTIITGNIEIIGANASLTVDGSTDQTSGRSVKLTGGGDKVSTQAPPSVTISKGRLGNIEYTSGDNCTGSARVQLSGSSAYAGTISVEKGTVSIQSGHANGVVLKEGTLTVSGTGAYIGPLTLGANKDTTVNITGTGHEVGNVKIEKAANVTLNVPESNTNNFGEFTVTSGTYNKHTVKGGTWSGAVPYGALDSNLAWQLKSNTGKYTYYTQANLGEALTLQVVNGIDSNFITPTNSAIPGSSGVLNFTNANRPWGRITGLATNDVVILPTSINNITADRWFQIIGSDTAGNNTSSFPKGYRWTMPPDNVVTLNMGGGAASGNATKFENVQVLDASTSEVDTGIRASINGNVISITGSLVPGTSSIILEFTTDLVNTEGKPVKVQIPVVYNTVDKKFTFQNPGSVSYGYGITVPDLDRLRLSNDSVYTLSASIKEINLDVKLDNNTTGKTIEVTVNAPNYSTVSMRNGLKYALEGNTPGTTSYFDWTGAPAIVQALNDVRGGTTNSQIKSWTDSANRTHYLKTHQSVPSTGVPAADAIYDTVVLVPYLAVNVTNHNSQGNTMSATLTPMYRIEVRAGQYNTTNSAPIVVQTGRSLGSLPGSMTNITGDARDMVGAKIKFNTLNYPEGATNQAYYMTQDDTYVYTGAAKDGTYEWTITHAGNNGLGSVVFNMTDGQIKLYNATLTIANLNGDLVVNKGARQGAYNKLQAAVDDATNGQLIEIDPSYTGSTTITMTGAARTIYIQSNGKNIVAVGGASSSLVTSNSNGTLYAIRLDRDTNVVNNGNITITEITGGTASVNVNPASVGQTVTITLVPAAGYVSNGVTVRTVSGTNVRVNGSGNVYTFVMPNENVVVTPSFALSNGTGINPNLNTMINVSPDGRGTVITTASVNNNQAAPGSVVGVTTYPAAGYRTMGVNVTTNAGNTTAVRTSDNYFTFTVPVNATSVTVTPVYDRDNGTKFTDVWSTEYYSDAVAWAVSKGITDGQSTYLFGSTNTCTRAQMVTFLYRAAGQPSVSGIRNPFVDISPNEYYYNAVLWAVSKGITNGLDATHFGPGQTVTRAQTVTFLYRYAGQPASSTSNAFYDVPASQWYAKAVTWAANQGITNGKTATSFAPNSGCMRCEIVTFLYRDLNGIRA